MQLGLLVHEKRERARISLRQLERDTGLSHNYLSRLEAGEFSDVKLTVLARLVRRFEISLDELYLATGCKLTNELPEIEPFLRAKYPAWPESAVASVSEYCRYTYDKNEEKGGTTEH